MKNTWDGKPISPEKPFGATVIVYRTGPAGLEFLVLHRTYNGADYEGEWAWTPPSGARFPGEAIEACAKRELGEETGLALQLAVTRWGTEDWQVFTAKAGPGTTIRLSEEHDRWEWMNAVEAVKRCRPDAVSAPLERAAEHLK